MKAYQLLALFALEAIAAPQATSLASVAPNPIPTGLDIDPPIVGKTVFDIVLDTDEEVAKRNVASARNFFERQAPDNKLPIISAEEASRKPAPGGGKSGVFYRGDSRPPSQIFKEGFKPQGLDDNLRNHLAFAGDSAFVSLSRSPESAERYAFGRAADKAQTGYIYVLAPKDVPDGYWIPGIYPPDKNPAVGINQEFAATNAVPGSSISHAYEVTRDNPSSRSKKVKNENYSLKSSPRCSIQKRSTCDPAKFVEQEEPKKKPVTGEKEEPKKGGKTPMPEEQNSGEKKGSKSHFTGNKIMESRFLQFLSELDAQALKPLVEAIEKREITVADAQLAFKRSLSETMEKRWTDFKNPEEALESLKNIAVDIFSTARYATPTGYWEDVIRNLPAIAKEIGQGKTPEEKLAIANKDINSVMKAWSYTPIGVLNDNLMNEAAKNTPAVQATAVTVNKLWSYTPLGWLVNYFAPVEPLLRKINAREEDAEF